MMKLPAVVLDNPKYPHNVGAAIRACSCFGVESLFWTGTRISIRDEQGHLKRLPREERMKGYAAVDWRNSAKPLSLLPSAATPVCVEVREHSECLTTFEHPENAVYVFGPEDGSVGQMWRCLCHRFVHIPAHHCLNLGAAVNVILADRRMKRQLAGLEPILPIGEMLHEQRGYLDTPAMDSLAWDGK
jgi:tRNA(Leu) C34 or U34 (ribose-2'-O)-methylase TrmL